MTAVDIHQALPDGFVWCMAGCAAGEHNDRPCITCGGLGYHRDPRTPRPGAVTRPDSSARPGTHRGTTPPLCPSCGHYRASHYVPGARDQKTCAAAVPTRKGLVPCKCRVRQDEIPKETPA